MAASYTYNAWGHHSYAYPTASGAAAHNPFRYKGYYYDSETGFYYCNSRYYDPSNARFISADTTDILTVTPAQLTDKNLYAYCDNNPIMRVDNGGRFWITLGIMAIGGAIGAAVSSVTSAVTQYALTGEVNWKSVGVAAASGFVSGAMAASPAGKALQTVVSTAVEVGSYVLDCVVNDTEITLDGVLIAAGIGVASGLLSGAGANQNKELTNSVKRARNLMQKEARRANRKYAEKATAKAIAQRNNVLSYVASVETIKYASITTGSSFINNGYGAYKNNKLFPNAFAWKWR